MCIRHDNTLRTLEWSVAMNSAPRLTLCANNVSCRAHPVINPRRVHWRDDYSVAPTRNALCSTGVSSYQRDVQLDREGKATKKTKQTERHEVCVYMSTIVDRTIHDQQSVFFLARVSQEALAGSVCRGLSLVRTPNLELSLRLALGVLARGLYGEFVVHLVAQAHLHPL